MKTRLKFLLSFILILALSVSMFTLSAAAAGTYKLSVNETCHGMIVHEFDEIISDSGLSRAIGSFCTGLNYSYDGRYILVDGTPATSGTFWLRGTAQLIDGSSEDYDFTIVVNADDPFYIPVETPAHGPAPEITKDPTGETLMEGQSAMFIARAENAEKIEWFLLDKNGEYLAPGYVSSLYPGFSCKGKDSEVFEIYNVPLELDGWSAVCIFSNNNDSIESSPAKITVEEFNAESPSITSHPQSASKSKGESVLLSVLADHSSGGTLKYQWYMSNTGASNLNPIAGANSSSYTPPQTVGTVYYTVAVWTSYNDRDSAKVYSNPAAITYTEIKTSPTPPPSATVAPTVKPFASAAPSPEQTMPNEKDRGGSGLLFGLIVALVLSAALAAVILLILRKNAKQSAEISPAPITQIKLSDIRSTAIPSEPVATVEKPKAPASVWQCSCGALNDSQFCTQCGKPRVVKRSCSNCGWTPDSPNQIPHFCPECGTAFDQD